LPALSSLVTQLVAASCRRPRLTLLAALALCGAALIFSAGHFAMTTDTAALISPKEPWRIHEAAMDAAFPDNTDTALIVLDGATPELAEAGASRLAGALALRKDVFSRVVRPDGGDFFAREGLLFDSLTEVKAATDQLLKAQPVLGPLAADPSLRGVAHGLSTLAAGAVGSGAGLDGLEGPLNAVAAALEGVERGRPGYFSWQGLIAGSGPGFSAPLRRFIITKPRLDYDDLTPGARATHVARAAAEALHLNPGHGVRVRITGSVPLSDEEFSSLADKAWMVGSVMGASMLLMLWLAVRSWRMVGAIVATTLCGLILTAALGLLCVGRFNLISVAFIPLFVGLGVDFGIQLAVRFRAERLTHKDLAEALAAAAEGVGGALALAAAAITLGFFAFLPTAYVGVSELGVIAGLGMIIALVLSATLLPALLVLLRVPAQTAPARSLALARLDRFLVERRRLVLWGFALSMALSVAALPAVQFDFNPLHLKNPRGEAMSTLQDLMRDPDQSPNTIDVLTPSLGEADAVAAKLSALPEVSQAVTLTSFVPRDQPAKLAAISDAQTLLDPTLNPFDMAAPPTDADTAAALKTAGAALAAAASADHGAGGRAALRLSRALGALAEAAPAQRAAASGVLIAPLGTFLDGVRALLTAQPVTLASLPATLRAEWIAPSGAARIQVFPKGAVQDNAALVRFAKAVRSVAPEASGGPISIQEAGRTIAWAFIEAGLLSLAAITLLLLVVLRSGREVAFTLAPIVLSGFLTLGTCVVIGQPINFANIIAFPLLFGVGVAFHIYFVMAWRAGARDFLQSSLARAVFFSALTTGAAFGALMLSSHPGTASMGKILMIALVWTLICALIFEPALLGPPKAVQT